MKVLIPIVIGLLVGCGTTSEFSSQPNKLEYKFSDVANLPIQKSLADPFLMPDGKRVESSQDWMRQRDYLKAMLTNYQYGQMPPRPKQIKIKKVGSTKRIYEGKGIEERYTFTIYRNQKSVTCGFLLVRPVLKKRYPTVI